MKILTTMAVSALMISAVYAQSTTTTNTSTATTGRNSTLEKIKKNFGLRYSARLRGGSITDPGADQPVLGSESAWGNNQIRNRIDMMYKLSNGDQIIFRNDVYNNANNRTTMDDPTIGYEQMIGKVWTRASVNLPAKKEDREAGFLGTTDFVAFWGDKFTNKFSFALIPWAGMQHYSEDKRARSAYLGNEIDLYYKLTDKSTATFRYELEYAQTDKMDNINNMYFSYSNVTAGVNFLINKQLSIFPALVAPTRNVTADSTTLYGELIYTFF